MQRGGDVCTEDFALVDGTDKKGYGKDRNVVAAVLELQESSDNIGGETLATARSAASEAESRTTSTECKSCFEDIEAADERQLAEICPHIQMCVVCFKQWLATEMESVDSMTCLRCPARTSTTSQPHKHYFSNDKVTAAPVQCISFFVS